MSCPTGKQSQFTERWLIWDRPCTYCTPLTHNANHIYECALHGLASISERLSADSLARNVIKIHQSNGWPNQSVPGSLCAAPHDPARSCSRSTHTALLQHFCQCCETHLHPDHLSIPLSASVPWTGRGPLLPQHIAVGGNEVMWGVWNDRSSLHVKPSHWWIRLQICYCWC